MDNSKIAYHLYRLENWATKEQRYEAFNALMRLPQTTEVNSYSDPPDEYMGKIDDYTGLIGEDYTISRYGDKLVVISSGGAYDIDVYQITIYSQLNPESLLIVAQDMTPMELYKYMTENE